MGGSGFGPPEANSDLYGAPGRDDGFEAEQAFLMRKVDRGAIQRDAFDREVLRNASDEFVTARLTVLVLKSEDIGEEADGPDAGGRAPAPVKAANRFGQGLPFDVRPHLGERCG